MDTLKRITGVYLILVAAAVAVHMVVEPLYYASTEAQPYSPFWNILNPCMALAIALAVLFCHLRMKRANSEGESGPVTRGYLCANVLYFGTLFIGLLFFWNWFNLQSPGIHSRRAAGGFAHMGNHRRLAAAAFGRDGWASTGLQLVWRQGVGGGLIPLSLRWGT